MKKAYLHNSTIQSEAIRQIYKRYTWRYTRSRILIEDGSIDLIDEVNFPGARFVSAVQRYEFSKYLYAQRKDRLVDEFGSSPAGPRYIFTLELHDADRPLDSVCVFEDRL